MERIEQLAVLRLNPEALGAAIQEAVLDAITKGHHLRVFGTRYAQQGVPVVNTLLQTVTFHPENSVEVLETGHLETGQTVSVQRFKYPVVVPFHAIALWEEVEPHRG